MTKREKIQSLNHAKRLLKEAVKAVDSVIIAEEKKDGGLSDVYDTLVNCSDTISSALDWVDYAKDDL